MAALRAAMEARRSSLRFRAAATDRFCKVRYLVASLSFSSASARVPSCCCLDSSVARRSLICAARASRVARASWTELLRVARRMRTL